MRLGVILYIIGIMCFAPASYGVQTVTVTEGNVNPLPIALPYLQSDDFQLRQIGRDIIKVVANDLEHSGLFRSISRSAFIEKEPNPDSLPNFANWRQVNSAGLVTGKVRRESVQRNGRMLHSIVVEWRLWDVFIEQQVAGSKLSLPENEWPDHWRRIAHLISDEIYTRLSGETAYFDTRIVYVAETGSALNRVKRLAIQDHDGANHKYLTSGKHLVLTPRFSPTVQQIIYLSYANNKPRVYLRDIENGNETILGDFEGMSFAPRFSPDGKRVIMSVITDGNSDIYEMDLKTKITRRLTYDSSIDTSPSYSPNGKHIVFNSDRGGSQQLYVMTRKGRKIKRISFGKGKYGSPVWSPRGDLIAFTKIYNNRFYIGVMRSDGSGERLLTESYLDESPTWAPNGRVIMFTRQDEGYGSDRGKSKLVSIDLTGYNEQEIATPVNASDPAWSPLLSN